MPRVGRAADKQTHGCKIDRGAAHKRVCGAVARVRTELVGVQVLVVDDDLMCLKVVSAMLQRCSYEGRWGAEVPEDFCIQDTTVSLALRTARQGAQQLCTGCWQRV